MAKIYWCPVVKDRLVLDDEAVTVNGADVSSLLTFDLHNNGVVSIYQDSNVQMIRDKFEAIGESVEVGDVDQTIDMILEMLIKLEERDNDRNDLSKGARS